MENFIFCDVRKVYYNAPVIAVLPYEDHSYKLRRKVRGLIAEPFYTI